MLLSVFSNVICSISASKQALNTERIRKKSSDSKTSIESVDKLDSNFVSADDLAALSLDVLRSRVAQRRRDSASGRRNSDGNGNGEEMINFLFHPHHSSHFHYINGG